MAGLTLLLTGDWDKASSILTGGAERFQKATQMAVMKEAHNLRGHMVKNLTTGGAHAGKPFAPLSPGTLIMRRFKGFGGSKPLIATAGMRNSIAVINVGGIGGAVFVGIRRGGKGGANLATLHEFGGGYSKPMTARQRRFLHAVFGRGGAQSPSKGTPGMLTIRIPARPFVGPVLEKFGQPDDIKKRFWGFVAAGMGYQFGK